MIQREFYMTRSDGVNLFRTYSDENFKIRQIETGIIYDEAIDVENAPYTYEETDILISDLPLFEGTNIITIDTQIAPSESEIIYYKDWRLN